MSSWGNGTNAYMVAVKNNDNSNNSNNNNSNLHKSCSNKHDNSKSNHYCFLLSLLVLDQS